MVLYKRPRVLGTPPRFSNTCADSACRQITQSAKRNASTTEGALAMVWPRPFLRCDPLTLHLQACQAFRHTAKHASPWLSSSPCCTPGDAYVKQLAFASHLSTHLSTSQPIVACAAPCPTRAQLSPRRQASQHSLWLSAPPTQKPPPNTLPTQLALRRRCKSMHCNLLQPTRTL